MTAYVGFLTYLVLVSTQCTSSRPSCAAAAWLFTMHAAPGSQPLASARAGLRLRLPLGMLDRNPVQLTRLPCLHRLLQTPEGAQRLAATISRNVSRLSLLGSAAGNSSSGSLTAAGGGGQAAAEAEVAPLLPPPPSPFDQPQAGPQQADDAGQINHAGQAGQEAEPTLPQAGRSGPAEGVAAADAEAEAAAPSGFVSGYVST